jgi:hypothetical protein
MTPDETLAKYRSIVVVDADHKALTLSIALNKVPHLQRRPYFAGDHKTGFFYLFGPTDVVPDCVMETVMSPHEKGDSVTSLYRFAPCFASPGELMRARGEVIAALSDKVGLSPESIGIEDITRGRVLGVNELAFGQLIDMLNERSTAVVMVTDTHSQALPAESDR